MIGPRKSRSIDGDFDGFDVVGDQHHPVFTLDRDGKRQQFTCKNDKTKL